MNDLGHAADGRRDDGGADGQCLDGSVRQVLPEARQNGRAGPGEGPQDLLAGTSPGERHPFAERELAHALLERGALGPVPHDEQARARDLGERRQRHREPFLRGQAADVDEGAGGQPVGHDILRRGCRIDEHLDRPVEAPARCHVGQISARDDQPPRTPQRQDPQPLQRDET